MSGADRRLLIVEDEPLMASLLADALSRHRFEVRTAASVIEARRAIDDFDPDAAVLDIELGDGPSGLDLGHALALRRPDIAIIFLTRHPDAPVAGPAGATLPAGCGFLRKDRVLDADYLLASINAVLADRPGTARHDLHDGGPLARLTGKQRDVLRLIASGYTNERIALERSVALSTVERWTREIFRTLQIDTAGSVNPRVEAARRYIQSAGVPARP